MAAPTERLGRMATHPPLLLSLLTAMRPRQWVKNLVVFAALIFSLRLTDSTALGRACLAFVLFCATSGAVYIVNDLFDAERDRRHPTKSRRPIASGALGFVPALVAVAALLSVALGAGFVLSPPFGAVLLVYAALNLAYSTWLKEVVILDVMALATGFVIRAVAGGVVIDVPISPWLVICTFLLALFMGFAKRRHEVILLDASAADHRRSLRDYSPYFLDQMIAVVTASTVLAYATYTISPEVREKLGTEYLYLTIPFVLFGIFRYLYLVHQKEEGGNPTQLMLTDVPLIIDVFLWGLTAAFLLYWGR